VAKNVKAKKKIKAKAKPVKKATPTKKTAKKAVKKTAKPVKKAAPKKSAAKKSVTKAVKATKPAAKKSVKAKPASTKTKKSAPVKAVAFKPTVKPAPKAKVDYTKAITPLGDRLVVRLTQVERMSPGGLFLPDSVSSTTGYLKGEVLAAGHGTFTKKGHHKLLDVKIGDLILFSDYSSTKIKYNDEDLHIVHETDVLGVTK
jgi:chaperonin GroES